LKVALINTLYAPTPRMGGAELCVQSLAEGLTEAGHQAVVISAVPEKGIQIDWVNGVKVYYIGLKNLYWPYRDKKNPVALKPLWHALDTYNPWMIREGMRILIEERPDLVHTNTLAGFSPQIWQVVKQQDLPIVHTLHDHYLLCPRSSLFRKGENCRPVCTSCRLFTVPRRYLSNCVDSVVGVSQYVLDRHLELGYFASTPTKRVIYNAYQAESAARPSETGSLPIRFGYLGRLMKDKGIEVLLKSVRQLPEGAWSLDVAGRGQAAYESYLHTRYNMPAIKFLGYIKPEIFFSNIDILVVPSLIEESFSRVTIEAYAHGVPVIGSNRGGIPELVEDERTGSLFDPGTPGDLSTRLQRYISKPAAAKRMQSACLRKAKGFLLEDNIRQYVKVYTDAAG
jgi:glycosyltransferase involved in cell wall biosynthesis